MHHRHHTSSPTPTAPKWFSLLELVIVIVIISILVVASRTLFTMPNQYLMESERCIAWLDGYVRQFFYHAISGKSLTISGDIIIPETYTMVFESWQWSGDFAVILWYPWESGGVIASETLTPYGGDRVIQWCQSDAHSVRLSWSLWSTIAPAIRIDIYKSDIRNTGMTICESDSNNNCLPNTSSTTATIDYTTCQIWSTWCQNAKTLFAQLFDTRIQMVKIKRCLSLPIDGQCRQRSTDEF